MTSRAGAGGAARGGRGVRGRSAGLCVLLCDEQLLFHSVHGPVVLAEPPSVECLLNKQGTARRTSRRCSAS